MKSAPKCFVSYSHDNENHIDWVSNLASRLVKNGVEVILDKWDVRLGGDLPSFMESGLTEADRVICVCSENYVTKANAGLGGVGYEKMILTAELMGNMNSAKVIPLIRNNNAAKVTPKYLQTKLYIDFRHEETYEKSYSSLIREIHGESIRARPALGRSPFEASTSPIATSIESSSSQYMNPSFKGKVEFDYDNHDGNFIIGSGSMLFELKFSNASNNSVHVYNSPMSIEGIALAYGARNFEDIIDASTLDYTSQARTPKTGELITLVNINGFFAAIKLVDIKARSHGADRSLVSFEYRINQSKEAKFE